MTGTQYKNVAQWTLANGAAEASESAAAAKAIFDNMGVPFPAGSCGEILLTSMDTDGVQQGFDLPVLKAIASSVPVPVIASGGAGTLRHFADALTEGEADAALAASLFHFGQLTIGEVKDYLTAQGIPVRRPV